MGWKASLGVLFFIGCESTPSPKPVTPPPPATSVAVEAPRPPQAIIDAGIEGAAPTADPNKVGSLYVIARSRGARFHQHQLGVDTVIHAGTSAIHSKGDELTPLPRFFDGIPAWKDIPLAKDAAFAAFNPPAGDRATWKGRRRILEIAGRSLDDVWLITERGAYQMWVGEVWHRTGGARSPFKLVRDLGKASSTFAAATLVGNETLLGLVHPYADNDVGAQGPRELYRFESFGAPLRPALPRAPKDCVTHVMPGGLSGLPTGEVFLHGQRCSTTDPVGTVARWAKGGAGPKVDTLPPRAPNAAVRTVGALVLSPSNTWIFGTADQAPTTDKTTDLPARAYTAHFNGTTWTPINAPNEDTVTHMAVATNGATIAFRWPTARYLFGLDRSWQRTSLEPAMQEVSAETIWYGYLDDLFVVGVLDKGKIPVLLRDKPVASAKPIELEDDEAGE